MLRMVASVNIDTNVKVTLSVGSAGLKDGVFFCADLPAWLCKRIQRRIDLKPDALGLVVHPGHAGDGGCGRPGLPGLIRPACQAPIRSARATKSSATISNSPSAHASIAPPTPRSSGRGT